MQRIPPHIREGMMPSNKVPKPTTRIAMSARIEIPDGWRRWLVARWRSSHTSWVFIFNSQWWHSSQIPTKFVKVWHRNDNLMNRKCVNFINPKLFPYLKLCVSSQGTVMILSLASFAGSKIQSFWFSQHLRMTRISVMVLCMRSKRKYLTHEMQSTTRTRLIGLYRNRIGFDRG